MVCLLDLQPFFSHISVLMLLLVLLRRYIVTIGASTVLCSSLLGSFLPQVPPLAFTMVAISVRIIRYVLPDEVPIPSLLQESAGMIPSQYYDSANKFDEEIPKRHVSNSEDVIQPLLHHEDLSVGRPLILKQSAECSNTSSDEKRRKIAAWAIVLTCVG